MHNINFHAQYLPHFMFRLKIIGLQYFLNLTNQAFVIYKYAFLKLTTSDPILPFHPCFIPILGHCFIITRENQVQRNQYKTDYLWNTFNITCSPLISPPKQIIISHDALYIIFT